MALLAVLGGGVGYRLVSFRAFFSAQTYAYALITVLLYGAPIYAFLSQRGHANWLAAAVLGVALCDKSCGGPRCRWRAFS